MDMFKQMRDAESWLEWKAKEYGKNLRYKDWVKKNSGCDQSLVFVIANKEGRGYASPIASGGSDNSPERAILKGLLFELWPIFDIFV